MAKKKISTKKPVKSKKATTLKTKTTKKKSTNPAELSLTDAQNNVYRIVRDRQGRGLTTTSGDVAEDWGDKNRSYVYRVLKALITAGLVERYSQRYYKLA